MVYFKDTDTLYFEFRELVSVESRDLDGDTVIDLDVKGRICSVTFEHASERGDIDYLTVEGFGVHFPPGFA